MADTATIQVNTPGMASTDEGYISSITVYTSGGAVAKTSNATTGQISVSPQAATVLVQDYRQFKLVQGGT